MTGRRQFLGAAAAALGLSVPDAAAAAGDEGHPSPPPAHPPETLAEIGDVFGGVTADRIVEGVSVEVTVDYDHDGREQFKTVSLDLRSEIFSMGVSLDDDEARELGETLIEAAEPDGPHD